MAAHFTGSAGALAGALLLSSRRRGRRRSVCSRRRLIIAAAIVGPAFFMRDPFVGLICRRAPLPTGTLSERGRCKRRAMDMVVVVEEEMSEAQKSTLFFGREIVIVGFFYEAIAGIGEIEGCVHEYYAI